MNKTINKKSEMQDRARKFACKLFDANAIRRHEVVSVTEGLAAFAASEVSLALQQFKADFGLTESDIVQMTKYRDLAHQLQTKLYAAEEQYKQLQSEVAALRSQAKSNREFAAEQLEEAAVDSFVTKQLSSLSRVMSSQVSRWLNGKAAALRAQEPAPPNTKQEPNK